MTCTGRLDMRRSTFLARIAALPGLALLPIPLFASDEVPWGDPELMAALWRSRPSLRGEMEALEGWAARVRFYRRTEREPCPFCCRYFGDTTPQFVYAYREPEAHFYILSDGTFEPHDRRFCLCCYAEAPLVEDERDRWRSLWA